MSRAHAALKAFFMAFEAGFSKVEISPPVVGDLSIPILGFWWERAKAYGEVHDPLYARAACFRDGDRFTVVSMDAFGDGIGLTDSIRKLASEKTGIPREKIMVCSTHAHTAPETYGLCWNAVDGRWLDWVAERVASAVEEAERRLELATMRVATARTEGLVVNRRASYVMERVAKGEARLSPEEIARSTDLDENLYAFTFLGADRSPVGIIVNFACHPVIMQTVPVISSDYAGFVAEEAEKLTGATTLYLNGPCGDVNPACGDTGNYSDVVALGTRLASCIQRIANNFDKASQVEEPVRLSARRAVAKVRRRGLPRKEELLEEKERLEGEIAARSMVPPPREDGLGAALFSIREKLTLYEMPEAFDAEVQVFSFGPHSIVGIPGELFACLGRDIRMAKRGVVQIATLANKILGYIAPREAFAAGGYETQPARWSRLAPGSGEEIRDAAVKLLRS
ncbi:MAG: neutral/alkaline non-lysosomal ceramidase N-terminal domain-containing protein [Candidatus Brockarchaeota archaeon]|nr:neutral/alkaline non-lysosomal ceramidase N-terminal domain-containing protein [Candidatus Brockarchaeota archaeon]